jgi:hypothetical protein
MLEISRPPSPGQIVRVRQRQYLAEEVVLPEAGDATLVRLACLDDDSQGQELQVLWEAEPDALVLKDTGWDHLAKRGFDPPRLFSAYLHTLRWNCVTATNPRLFQAPFRAGIRIDAYQIEPLSTEQAQGKIAKVAHDLLAGNDPGPVTFRLKPTRKADETYPLRLGGSGDKLPDGVSIERA